MARSDSHKIVLQEDNHRYTYYVRVTFDMNKRFHVLVDSRRGGGLGLEQGGGSSNRLTKEYPHTGRLMDTCVPVTSQTTGRTSYR